MKSYKSFDNSRPVLYLIATPIGNLKEFSSRAIETIQEMDIVAAEDTRNTGDLLNKFGIKKKLISLREHNETEMSELLIKEINSGKKVAYVSDAGYPGISDPGSIFAHKAIDNGIAVSVISGGCAFINGLVGSGLPTNHFYFHGFLSSKETDAKKELENLKYKKETLIFYESPHRIKDTLKLMNEILGDRNFSLQRELTKLHEEKIYGVLNETSKINFEMLKGEMVIIVDGDKNNEEINEKDIQNRVNYLINKGLSKKDAIESVSELWGIKKNKIKDLFD